MAKRPLEMTNADAAEVGRAFMGKLPDDFDWNVCPTEYVIALIDARDEARKRVNDWLCKKHQIQTMEWPFCLWCEVEQLRARIIEVAEAGEKRLLLIQKQLKFVTDASAKREALRPPPPITLHFDEDIARIKRAEEQAKIDYPEKG